MKIKIGDKVIKPKGYFFRGVVVSVFKNSLGQERYVVEHSDSITETNAGMLHIFNEQQIKLV